jgi:hypothetical protein
VVPVRVLILKVRVARVLAVLEVPVLALVVLVPVQVLDQGRMDLPAVRAVEVMDLLRARDLARIRPRVRPAADRMEGLKVGLPAVPTGGPMPVLTADRMADRMAMAMVAVAVDAISRP